MSLINQMLHDLDKRNPRGSRSPGYVVAGLHSPRSSIQSISPGYRISTATVILLSILGLLLVAVIWRYTTLLTTTTRVSQSIAIQSDDLKSSTPVSPAKVIESVDDQVQRVSTNQSADLTTSPPIENGRSDDNPEELLADVEEQPPAQPITRFQPPVTATADPRPVVPVTTIAKLEPLDKASLRPENTVVQPITNNPPIIKHIDQHPLLPAESGAEMKDNTSLKKKFRPVTDEQRAENSFMSGLAAIQKGNSSEGMDELRDALAIYPAHIKAREILAGLLIKAGQNTEAALLLHKGIEIHPEHSQFTKLYARILIDEGNTQEALKALEANRPPLNDNPEYYALLAAVYQRLNQSGQAADLYYRLVTLQPQSGIYWMGLGISLEADGKPVQAVEAYQRAKVSGTLNEDLLHFINGKIDTLKNIKTNPAA